MGKCETEGVYDRLTLKLLAMYNALCLFFPILEKVRITHHLPLFEQVRIEVI